MALLNFQKRFAEAVETGKKRQTIRKQRKYPIKVGDTLYLYTGLRTKKARRLMITKCKSVEKIKICWNGIMFYNRTLTLFVDQDGGDELGKFARADGFPTWRDMWVWFEETHGLPFEGILIKW